MNNISFFNKSLGIIGGGQLGKMIGMEAARLGFKVYIFSDEENAPAFQIANEVFISSYKDKKELKEFAKVCDIVTYEFENIPFETIKLIKKYTKVFPDVYPLEISQDRFLEKKFIKKLGIDVAEFYLINSIADLKKVLTQKKNTYVLKTRRLGYDGKGQMRLENSNLSNINFKIKKNKFIIEKLIKFKKEISVIVVRKKNGNLICYEPAENYHKDGILRESKFPATISNNCKLKAKRIAKKIANSLNITGILAVEMFVCEKENLIVNEIAPRPHNTGHLTLDACNMSQFEALVRVLFDLPIVKIKYFHNCKMINLLGENLSDYSKSLNISNHKVYLYGKQEVREKRKLGHINILS